VIARNRANRKLGVSIAWNPVDDAYYRLAAMLRTSRSAAPIYVTQRVLTDVEAFCSRNGFVYGLLVGELCSEPKTGREYVLVDGTVPPPASAPGHAGWDQIAVVLDALANEASRQGKVPLGWYRAIDSIASAKARDAVAFHRSLFPSPWQVMLAVVQGASAGGRFVRVEPSDGRAYSAPFFEVVSAGKALRGGQLGSVLAWESYQTTDPVVRLATPPASPGMTATAPIGHSGQRRIVDTLNSLRGAIRQAPEPAVASSARGTAATRPLTPPPLAPNPRPAERLAVTFPLLVPAQSSWAKPRWHPLLRWGVVGIAVGLLTVGAILAHRVVRW
jgi:hypothetical protein